MSWPQHQNPSSGRPATAPYNFVPLPEAVVEAAGELPPHDEYDLERNTGHFEVTLTTYSPLYIRSPLTLEEFCGQGTGYDDFRDDPKNKADFFHTREGGPPVIPGSSLHGMLRGLVEIVSYGKMRQVTDVDKIFYRAVYAPGANPLEASYNDVLGNNGRNVRAGYLKRDGNSWFVRPAKHPSALLSKGNSKPYIKVKERHIPHNAISGFIPMASIEEYEPGWYDVGFNLEAKKGKRGWYRAIKRIGDPNEDAFEHRGALVCSGHMLESGNANSKLKRRNHTLLPEPDEDEKENPIRISTQAVRDYKDALTDFQKDHFGPESGCLEDGRPIFYVEPDDGEDIFYFGHSPNFRIPALLTDENGHKHAATPRDFVPKALRESAQIDYAEALFGYAGDDEARAGRVAVTDAALAEDTAPDDLWLDAPGDEENTLVPAILGSPKPTCFPHYLVQEKPSTPKKLRHYDSDTPGQTVIRGHKRYWHRDDVRASQIKEQDDDWLDDQGEVKASSTQHTQMRPVQSGVEFSFRIEFENLSGVELGALCWALRPQGDADEDYCHQLGMGKPLGLGAVKLGADLHLEDRQARYQSLFDDDGWVTGANADGPDFGDFVADFEKDVLRKLYDAGGQFADDAKRLRDLGRIGMLLKMMEWPGPDSAETAYMELDDFEAHRVLPAPSAYGALTGYKGIEEPSAQVASGKQSSPSYVAKGQCGTLKWYSSEKGYGFIAPDEGSDDVFVHISNVEGLGYGDGMGEGERLEYDVEETPKGLSALNVTRLDG